MGIKALLKKRQTEAERVGSVAKVEASRTAQQVAAQILEPALHVARWAMIIALGSFLLAAIGVGLAVWSLRS